VVYHQLIWIDFVILALVGISAIIGLLRGFVLEIFSVATWLVAIWVGLSFSREFASYLEPLISLPSARMAASFAVLFFVTLILGGILGSLLSQIISKTGLTGTDRFAGLLFGIGRGMLVVSVLVMLAGLTPLPEDPWWRESQLIEPFQNLALWLQSKIPAGMAGYIAYH